MILREKDNLIAKWSGGWQRRKQLQRRAQILTEGAAKGEIKDKMKKGAKAVESRLEILSELSGILFGKADSRLFWKTGIRKPMRSPGGDVYEDKRHLRMKLTEKSGFKLNG